MKYWQHDETGLITNCGYQPSGRWYEIPIVYEDELPELSEREYDRWYALSSVVDGVRVGPHPYAPIIVPKEPDSNSPTEQIVRRAGEARAQLAYLLRVPATWPEILNAVKRMTGPAVEVREAAQGETDCKLRP